MGRYRSANAKWMYQNQGITLERFTISLDDDLATDFDQLIQTIGYENRSEAVRDLIRQALEKSRQASAQSLHSIGVVSYVYNHHEKVMADRLIGAQHDHHDLLISSMHTHLDHDHCLEAVFLRGQTEEIRRFAGQLTAMSGIRHGSLNLISADMESSKHSHGGHHTHTHLKPKN